MALLGVVGACYGPAGEATCVVTCAGVGAPCPGAMICNQYRRCEAPGGPTCGPNGEVIDAGIDGYVSPDAARDAPGSMMCTPQMPTQQRLIASGGSAFTIAASRMRAAHLVLDNVDATYAIEVADGDIDNGAAQFVTVIHSPFSGFESLDFPRLSSDGKTIFMLTNDSNLGIHIAFSNRLSASAWQVPSFLVLKDASGLGAQLDLTAIPGTPSGISPRRMPIANAAGFTEYEELASPSQTWKEKFTYVPGDLGVTSIKTPNFSNNALRVVFAGTTLADSNLKIFYADRPNPAVKFGPATMLYDAGGGITESTPTLTEDCAALYYNNDNASAAYRAN